MRDVNPSVFPPYGRYFSERAGRIYPDDFRQNFKISRHYLNQALIVRWPFLPFLSEALYWISGMFLNIGNYLGLDERIMRGLGGLRGLVL